MLLTWSDEMLLTWSDGGRQTMLIYLYCVQIYIMKKILLLPVIFALSTGFSNAQFFKPILPNSAFADSLNKIVLDFRFDFKKTAGKRLPRQGNMDVYQSKVILPGAAHCVIYRFHSSVDTTASWQATLYEGDSYEEALKVYKNTFTLVKKSRLVWIDKSIVGFSGNMEAPDENLRFTISSLRLDINDPGYNKFVAEIELVNSYDGWEVHLNLQNKKNDAEEY